MQVDESRGKERRGCKDDKFAQARALNDGHEQTVGGCLDFLLHQWKTGLKALNTAAAMLNPKQKRSVAITEGVNACIAASGYDVSASSNETTLNACEDEHENDMHESARIK